MPQKRRLAEKFAAETFSEFTEQKSRQREIMDSHDSESNTPPAAKTLRHSCRGCCANCRRGSLDARRHEMKDGTEELMKFKLLVTELGLDPCYVGGILQFIWKFASKNCPRGDIGKFSNEEIAVGIGYTGDPDALIAALVKRKWIDEVGGEMRLVIHDWPEHAEDSVHRKVARRKQWFADGTQPNLSRLQKGEKTKLAKFYAANTYNANAQRAHDVHTSAALCAPPPEPEPEPEPMPEPTPEPSLVRPRTALVSGVRMDLTPETLRDVRKLRQWFDQDSARADGWVNGSEADWENVQATAAKATTCEDIKNQVGFAKSVIKGRQWHLLRASDEDVARDRAREQDRNRSPPVDVSFLKRLEPEQRIDNVGAIRALAAKKS
jgi:hypothetical protein